MICLWTFSESDFAAWRKLVGTPEVDSYAGYLTMLAAVQADCERQGMAVNRVRFSVAAMIQDLKEMELENTPANRAAITAMRA